LHLSRDNFDSSTRLTNNKSFLTINTASLISFGISSLYSFFNSQIKQLISSETSHLQPDKVKFIPDCASHFPRSILTLFG
jgi:hypothetical protein